MTETAQHTETIAKIRSVRLGWEDHGIFTCNLDLDYGGSSQGAGGYCLDEPRHTADKEFVGRFGTAFGMEWIIRTMKACGATDWKQVEGTTVIALREEGYNGKVVGIKPLPTEKGEPFIFEELSMEFGHRS